MSLTTEVIANFVDFWPILAKLWLPWQRHLDPCNQKCLLWIGRPRKLPVISNRILVIQGWARDVNGRDRDETETLAFRDRDETKTFGLTSRDETETRRSTFETRPRRDVCRSRDVTETLKCTFIVINAV